jgi:hypothetical protein
MIFPISRAHQARTAASLDAGIRAGRPAVIHLVKFPALTINHSMVLYEVAEIAEGLVFQAYDPNDPVKRVELFYNRKANQFSLPPRRYWAGGALDIIEIYRSWLM